VSVLKQLGPRADGTLTQIADGGSSQSELFWTIRAQLEEVAHERPLVVVFDDIQWGEPTFLDLLDHIADLSRGAPILLLCLARPDLLDRRPGWGGGKLNTTTMLLEPLSRDECDELIESHGDVIGAETRMRILEADRRQPALRRGDARARARERRREGAVDGSGAPPGAARSARDGRAGRDRARRGRRADASTEGPCSSSPRAQTSNWSSWGSSGRS